VGFTRSDGFVLDPARDDEELALVELDYPVSKVNRELAGNDQEQFVLGIVVVPDEFALELGKLDVLVIQLTDNARAPVFRELSPGESPGRYAARDC